MRKLFLLITLITSAIGYSQASTKLNNAQNVYSTGQPRVIVSTDTLPSGLWRTYPKPLVTWPFSQITSKPTTLAGYSISDAYPLTGNPSNFLTGITSTQVTTALGFTPYNSSNPNAYISGITSGMVQSALGYLPVNPSGSSSQYIAGDGSKITFPSIPASQQKSDWLSSSGVTEILNKPIIATNVSQLLNDAGYITSVPAQSFTSLTGKPTTLSGYGITDSYPLTGNPSNFLIGITGTQVTTALGYTPIQGNGTSLQYIDGTGAKVTFPTISYPVTSVNGKTGAVVLNSADVGAIAVGASIPYGTLTGAPTIPAAQIQSDWNQINNASLDFIKNKPTIPTNTTQLTNGSGYLTTVPAQTFASLTGKPTTIAGYGITDGINQAGARSAISLTTVGSSGSATYSNITGILNIPNYANAAPSYNNAPARTVAVSPTSYQISATRPSRMSYTVAVTTSLSLLNLNSTGQVFLEISADNINWTTINSAGISRTLSVAITLGINETSYFNIQGECPAGYYTRLRSTVAGTGTTVVFSSGQEVQY